MNRHTFLKTRGSSAEIPDVLRIRIQIRTISREMQMETARLRRNSRHIHLKFLDRNSLSYFLDCCASWRNRGGFTVSAQPLSHLGHAPAGPRAHLTGCRRRWRSRFSKTRLVPKPDDPAATKRIQAVGRRTGFYSQANAANDLSAGNRRARRGSEGNVTGLRFEGLLSAPPIARDSQCAPAQKEKESACCTQILKAFQPALTLRGFEYCSGREGHW